MEEISRLEPILFKIREIIKKFKGYIWSITGSFFFGKVTSMSSLDEFTDLFTNINVFNIILWFLLSFTFISIFLEKSLDSYYKKRRNEVKFSNLMKRKVADDILEFSEGKIAWGDAISLQTCPDLVHGWKLSEIGVDYNGMSFSMSANSNQKYEEYFEKNYEDKRFFDDGKKYMITENPSSFSDSETLKLKVEKTKYSRIQFYKDKVINNKEKFNYFLNQLFNESLKIEFPHSLCLHTIILTKDDKVLFTKRSSKVSYFPNKWSVSLEEQLSEEDFQGENEVILDLGKRLLKEELAINRDEYNENNLRIMSVFLESNILNCSLCGVFRLSITAKELNNIIDAKLRKDYEFESWKIVDWEKAVEELLKSPDDFHPTSGYRIIMGLIGRFGYKKALEKIFKKRLMY